MSNPHRPRSLKVEATGDYFYRQTVPKIRLQGKWLESLGFKANGRVLVHPTSAGELLLKFCPDSQTKPLTYE